MITESREDYDQTIVDALEGVDFDVLDVNDKFSKIYAGHLCAHYNIIVFLIFSQFFLPTGCKY